MFDSWWLFSLPLSLLLLPPLGEADTKASVLPPWGLVGCSNHWQEPSRQPLITIKIQADLLFTQAIWGSACIPALDFFQ